MKKVKLEIVGMSYSQSQSGAYALILGIPGQKKGYQLLLEAMKLRQLPLNLRR